MYPWTSTDHTLYMCTHTTRTMLSQGWVVREYNVSMDIHGSFIVCTHKKDHVVPGLGSSRIQCIHGHPQIIHCTCVHAHTTRTTCTLSHGLVVREYNVSMDIHGSYIVHVYTHNKDYMYVVPWFGSSRIQCIHGHPRIIHCMCVHTQQGPCCPRVE